MQDGMAHFQGVVTPESFPDDTLFGRFQLVLIGIAITLVTQSSSAGVAAALVALHAGAISFPQAAAMVIGMDVGTTFTAALATIGGSAATRQTGYAHVLYNVLTGAMAFLLLGPFTTLVTPYLAEGSATNAQIALVGFHTLFNTLGVILVVPFAAPFGRLVTRLVRERGPRLTRRLDDRLLRDPASAIDAAVATIDDIAQAVITTLAELLAPDAEDRQARLATIGEALRTTQDFVQRVRTDVSAAGTHARHLAVIHTLDHLVRLSHRCTQRDRIDHLGSEPRLQRLTCILRRAVTHYLAEGSSEDMEMRLDRLRAIFRDQRERYRTRTLDAAARQQIGTDTALRQLDSVRWLQRVSYHLWRIEHHQRLAMLAAPPPATATPAAIPIEED